jgi:outer membrane receptor for ferrienterochelin and colicins
MQKLLLLLIFFSTIVSAQDKKLFVLDASTGEPVPFANVCVETEEGKQSYSTTNGNGEVLVAAKGEIELSISFIGYKTFKQIIDISETNTIELLPDVFALEQVVVTGQGKPMLRDSSIYSIKVFDSNIIQQRGAVDLGDVLSAQPSIKIKQSGTFGSNISILGLGGENVKIMIDGVPIIGRLDGNLDLNQITMENVDHIEVIEGPMSVIYGSNALAGTINIITKNNKRNKFLLSANTYVESPGTVNADVLASGKFGNNVVTGSLVRNYFTGTSFDDSRQSKWRGSTQYSGELKYAYYGKNFTFRTNGKYFDEFMKDKGRVYGEGGPTPYATDKNYLTNRYSFNSFLDFFHNDDMQTNVQASVSYYDRIMQTVNVDMTDLSESIITNETDTTSFLNFMTRATFNHKVNNKVSYQTGIDINAETGKTKRIQGGEQSIADYAIFITGKHEFWKGIIIQPGFRYAYNSKFSSPLLYSLNVKADLFEGWQTRISFAKGFRSPTLKELYLDFSPGPIYIIGNPDLTPETSYTLNGSIDYTFRNEDELLFKTEFKAYGNKMFNMIDFAKIGNSGGVEVWQNINRGEIVTLGFVADVNLDLNGSWSFNSNFSRGGITSLEYVEDNTLKQFVYTNNFLASVTYKLPKCNFTTRIEYSFNGEEPARYIDDVTKIEPMVESYSDINLTLTKSFLNRRLNLSAGVKNLLDNQDLQYIGGTPSGGNSRDDYRMLSWGRSYFIKLNFQLNKN